MSIQYDFVNNLEIGPQQQDGQKAGSPSLSKWSWDHHLSLERLSTRDHLSGDSIPSSKEDCSPRLEDDVDSMGYHVVAAPDIPSPLATSKSSKGFRKLPKYTRKDFVDKVDVLVEEYLSNYNVNEFMDELSILASRCYHDVVADKLFRMSIERKREVENEGKYLLSVLMDSDLVNADEMMRGMYRHVFDITDLELDVPYAKMSILNWLNYLVLKNLLPESIFYKLPEDFLVEGKTHHAKKIRQFKHTAYPTVSLIYRYDHLGQLQHILPSEPFMKHEFVKHLLSVSFDYGGQIANRRVDVLKYCMENKYLDKEDIHLGVAFLLGRMHDLLIDVPHALKYTENMLIQLIQHELVSTQVLKNQQLCEYGGSLCRNMLKDVLYKTPKFSRPHWNDDGEDRGLHREMELAIAEYFDSYDIDEVYNITEELKLTREQELRFLRMIVLSSFSHQDFSTGLDLISELTDWCWSVQDIEDALESIRNDTDDLYLDYPLVENQLSEFFAMAEDREVISCYYGNLDRRLSQQSFSSGTF